MGARNGSSKLQNNLKKTLSREYIIRFAFQKLPTCVEELLLKL